MNKSKSIDAHPNEVRREMILEELEQRIVLDAAVDNVHNQFNPIEQHAHA
jgi:hypothetical protein